ncbi:hypothetical protein SARC_01617 [Sphaeroforma arctica JP610]|uniref:Uncharacterized protein n=1 Tax=Sphaeroforma arctica JP610 TaxID=667725 RepID=A0A0L0GB45_9EUKA|nr:hypothetical protein SARC_01617 [Sphaeroforma arctica JP610]KNC86242.1 hypothetical protein SARC_01617 [Sphaeroforma arctica JP610]|eukprot:XP_014160144.1 hypothetical protein SARC_01617 [Sphaeroforma arctica JP610]
MVINARDDDDYVFDVAARLLGYSQRQSHKQAGTSTGTEHSTTHTQPSHTATTVDFRPHTKKRITREHNPMLSPQPFRQAYWDVMEYARSKGAMADSDDMGETNILSDGGIRTRLFLYALDMVDNADAQRFALRLLRDCGEWDDHAHLIARIENNIDVLVYSRQIDAWRIMRLPRAQQSQPLPPTNTTPTDSINTTTTTTTTTDAAAAAAANNKEKNGTDTTRHRKTRGRKPKNKRKHFASTTTHSEERNGPTTTTNNAHQEAATQPGGPGDTPVVPETPWGAVDQREVTSMLRVADRCDRARAALLTMAATVGHHLNISTRPENCTETEVVTDVLQQLQVNHSTAAAADAGVCPICALPLPASHSSPITHAVDSAKAV